MGLLRRFAHTPNTAVMPPQPKDEITAESLALIEVGRFAEALVVLERSMSVGCATAPPMEMARRHRLLAETQREMAQYDNAIVSADRGLEWVDGLSISSEVRLERVRLLIVRGQAQIEAGYKTEAETSLTAAITLSPPATEIDGALALRALGEVRSAQARHAEAEKLYARAMETLFRLLPKQHRERGHVVNSWGLAAFNQGRAAEAEERLKRGLELRRHALAPGHTDIGESLHNLATVILRQGRLDEAEALDHEAMAIWERSLGAQHPRIALCVGNLGAIAGKHGRYEEAEQQYRRGLTIREATLGPNHPRLVVSLNNIATVLQKSGRCAEAEAFLRRSLELARSNHGENHPDVAQALNNLYSILADTAATDEAETCLKRSITIWEATLGPNATELTPALTNLAVVQKAHGDSAGAEESLLRALSITAHRLGDHHPDLGTPLNNLANLYVERGNLDAAETLYLRAEELRRSAGYHPSAATLGNLAEIAVRQGRMQAHHDYLAHASVVLEKTLGRAAPQLPRYLRLLGIATRELGDVPEAVQILSRALSLQQRSNTDLTETGAILLALGATYFTAERPGEAEAVYRKGIALFKEAGDSHRGGLAEFQILLATVLIGTGRATEARPILEDSLRLVAGALGEVPTLTRSALVWLGYADILLGDYVAAEQHLMGSFGQADSPDSGGCRSSLALLGLRRLYQETGRPTELAAILENLVELHTSQDKPDRSVAGLLRELADSRFAANRYSEASELFCRVLAADDNTYSATFRGSTRFYLALCLAQSSDFDAAHVSFAAAAGDFGPERANEPDSLLLCLSIWMEYLVVRGRHAEAETLVPKMTGLVQLDSLPSDIRGSAFESLGLLYAATGRWQDAERAFRGALSAWQDPAVVAAVGIKVLKVRHYLARLDHARERFAEAESEYRAVIGLLKTVGPGVERMLSTVSNDLAGLLDHCGRRQEATEVRRGANTPAK